MTKEEVEGQALHTRKLTGSPLFEDFKYVGSRPCFVCGNLFALRDEELLARYAKGKPVGHDILCADCKEELRRREIEDPTYRFL